MFYAHKQFRSHFVALVENVPDLKQLLKDVFRRKRSSISLGFLHNFCFKKNQLGSINLGFLQNCSRKMIYLLGPFLLKILPRDCWICDAHKMLYFCNQNGIVTFSQSCLLVRFLVNTATFERSFGFLSFSVIVTSVDSRDGLVEPLLWSFVIAPLLSYSLNFCKGTITVIVWNQNTVAMQCLQFG